MNRRQLYYYWLLINLNHEPNELFINNHFFKYKYSKIHVQKSCLMIQNDNCTSITLYVKAKMHNVSVLHQVFFSLNAHLTRLLAGVFRSVLLIVG